MVKKIFFCGGDVRSRYMADYFAQRGYSTCCYGIGNKNDSLEELSGANAVVLGLPATKDSKVYMPISGEELGFEKMLSMCNDATVVFGGRFAPNDEDVAKKMGVSIFDYSRDEIFQVENAVYTAEGTIAKIIENTKGSVGHMKIFVMGFGRIANALCMLLKGWSCSVTVYARKDVARARCKAFGIDAVERIEDLSRFDVIINTVPASLLQKEHLNTVNSNALIVDLSARPGYVDKDLCEKNGINLLYLPGLPLSSAPQAAGITAAKAVERMWTL